MTRYLVGTALMLVTDAIPALPSKRGVGGAATLAQAGDLPTLTGVAWFYDWALTPPDAYVNDSYAQEFVPMVWGSTAVDDLANFTPSETSTALLGFNEPNLHTQSNLTAQEACEHWQDLRDFATTHGLRLGSPAVDYCTPNGSAQQDSNCWQSHWDWLAEFFGNCSVDSVDFITTHKYGCNATATLEYVTDLHAEYGKPVWLTEFSCSEAAASSQLAFQQEILPVFDSLPTEVLERYAWFATRTDQSDSSPQKNAALMYETSARNLTALGEYYNRTET